MEEQVMNTTRDFNLSGPHGRFRRRYDQSIIMGVCAGLADYFSFDRTVVRVVSLLLLFLLPLQTMAVYLLLAWLGDAR
jgi:phage shock protein PspC (stress-responsive transcriptional regulator)